MGTLEDVWPLYGLRLRTPRLELRMPREDDFGALLEVIDAGIHDPNTMPFAVPWTDLPATERLRGAVQHWWASRGSFRPEAWSLALAVYLDGAPIGFQDLATKDFVNLREGETGSWLGLAFQGTGYGKEMRAAIVHFAFTCLGAECITSTAFADNPASQNVSIATGYEPNGFEAKMRRGERAVSHRYRLSRSRWESNPPSVSVEVEGWTVACRAMFGLSE